MAQVYQSRFPSESFQEKQGLALRCCLKALIFDLWGWKYTWKKFWVVIVVQ